MTDLGIDLLRVGAPGRTRRRVLGRAWLPRALLVGAVVVLIVLPLLALLDAALEQGLSALLATMQSASGAIWASLWTSASATLLAVGVGALAAVLTERTGLPGRRWLRSAMLVAFIVPGYVAAMGWQAAYGVGGLLDDLSGVAVPALVGPLGIVAVLAVEAMPLTYLVVVAGLATRVEPDLERAARASGAGPLLTFRSITLPILLPVLGGAAGIAFVLSMTSFGVPAVLGIPAGFTTMTTRIYRDLAFSYDTTSFVRAIGLAIMLALIAAVIIALADGWLRKRGGSASGVFGGPRGSGGRRTRGSRPRAGSRSPTGVAGLAAAGFVWAVIIAGVLVPLLALLLTALSRAPGLAPTPDNWTFDNFVAVVDRRTLAALGNSLLLSGAAAAGVIVLGALVLMARRGLGHRLTGGMLGLSFALPGSTLAIAVLLAYGVALRDSLLIILVAYLAKFWALAYRPVAAGLSGIPDDAYHAARISGADAATTTRTVVLPLLRPMVVAGAMIVFIFGLHEVTMSSLLYGPGTATLAVAVLNLQQLGEAGSTAALALLLTATVLLVALPLLARTGALEWVGWRR